jgi:ketosteroid isomerase-like protein
MSQVGEPREASLLDAARRLADAERQGDVAALEQLVAADYMGYDPAGRPQDRAGLTRGYANGTVRITTLAQRDLRAQVIGEAGLVSGVSSYRGHQGEEPFDFTLRFLDVYAWREGRWQLVASQDTRLPWS